MTCKEKKPTIHLDFPSFLPLPDNNYYINLYLFDLS